MMLKAFYVTIAWWIFHDGYFYDENKLLEKISAWRIESKKNMNYVSFIE